jgi:hypothetical protein
MKMSEFYVVNESTEDTLEAADTLQDAVRLAKQAARRGSPGELISILESGGKSVGQFVLMPDGTVKEQPVASSAESVDATRP